MGPRRHLFSECDMFDDTEDGELLGQGSLHSSHVHSELWQRPMHIQEHPVITNMTREEHLSELLIVVHKKTKIKSAALLSVHTFPHTKLCMN